MKSNEEKKNSILNNGENKIHKSKHASKNIHTHNDV